MHKHCSALSCPLTINYTRKRLFVTPNDVVSIFSPDGVMISDERCNKFASKRDFEEWMLAAMNKTIKHSRVGLNTITFLEHIIVARGCRNGVPTLTLFAGHGTVDVPVAKAMLLVEMIESAVASGMTTPLMTLCADEEITYKLCGGWHMLVCTSKDRYARSLALSSFSIHGQRHCHCFFVNGKIDEHSILVPTQWHRSISRTLKSNSTQYGTRSR